MLKTTRILNPELLKALAGLGQNDYLVIANPAFPVDAGIPVIDLSLVAGQPTLDQVLCAVTEELSLDSAILPSELAQKDEPCYQAVKGFLGDIPCKEVMYEQVKVLAKHGCAVIRTGDIRPYASLILLAAGL